MPCDREVGMKIVVECDTNAAVDPCSFENGNILRLRHSDLCDMNRLEPGLAQDRRSLRGQTLVEQNARHATLSRLNRSSSTEAAA